MARIVVLGAGLVGRAIALDLVRRHSVTAADLDREPLARLEAAGVATAPLDVRDSGALGALVAGSDLVVGAVPGFLGFDTLRTVIEAGKPVVDISFCPEEALDLAPLARRHGVTALVDMGVAPGMDHVLLGHHDATMAVESFECLVGGLPICRKWPFEYKAPFSPVDVIELYTRPARHVEHGKVVTRPALSDPELIEFETVGTLEAFNTDGFRTLLHTMDHVGDMKEKTLRYPGHARLVQALQAAGFFAEDPITVGGARISPRDFSSRILIDEWTLGPDEEEMTVMRVTIRGRENGLSRTYVYDLHDTYDRKHGVSSMARTTGYTCTAACELLLQGLFTEKGLFAPESVGRLAPCYDFLLGYLAERGVNYRCRISGDEPAP